MTGPQCIRYDWHTSSTDMNTAATIDTPSAPVRVCMCVCAPRPRVSGGWTDGSKLQGKAEGCQSSLSLRTCGVNLLPPPVLMPSSPRRLQLRLLQLGSRPRCSPTAASGLEHAQSATPATPVLQLRALHTAFLFALGTPPCSSPPCASPPFPPSGRSLAIGTNFYRVQRMASSRRGGARWALGLLGLQTMAGCATGFMAPHAAARHCMRAEPAVRHRYALCTQATASGAARSRREAIRTLGVLASPLLWTAPVHATPAVNKVWGVAVPLDDTWAFDDTVPGISFAEVFPGLGITPSTGDMVRVQITAFSMAGTPVGSYAGSEQLFELGKADMPAGLESQVESMKIGAQRIIRLQPQVGFRTAAKRFQRNVPQVCGGDCSGCRCERELLLYARTQTRTHAFARTDSHTHHTHTQEEPVLLFVRLLGIKGRPCSSSMEERAKGNMVPKHSPAKLNPAP